MIRIIPRLDIKGPNLVKGIHLEGLRVLGKPWDFAQAYYRDGADELLYIDAVASLYGRNNLVEIVRRTAESIFIPLTVGGGVRSVDDVRTLLRAGADKVAINTAAIHDPSLIHAAAREFGSQCIVVSIQAKEVESGWECFTDNAREPTGVNVMEWALRAVALGAGELLVTSIDREGTGTGFAVDLIREIADSVPVPVIACGGCGRAEHVCQAVRAGHADAVALASILHYHGLTHEVDPTQFGDEGVIAFLRNERDGRRFMDQRLQPATLREIKASLQQAGVACRPDGFGA